MDPMDKATEGRLAAPWQYTEDEIYQAMVHLQEDLSNPEHHGFLVHALTKLTRTVIYVMKDGGYLKDWWRSVRAEGDKHPIPEVRFNDHAAGYTSGIIIGTMLAQRRHLQELYDEKTEGPEHSHSPGTPGSDGDGDASSLTPLQEWLDGLPERHLGGGATGDAAPGHSVEPRDQGEGGLDEKS